ncbi:cytochrome P450 [Ganoderma sinense ZZ0214-1]|uniref:Cytochrome P450 n=1 Tax=Ganoderma sinense ZZ0214-1 TaxID=1077348 RepID=A0A2G8SNF6_9APHY|nr:cytochrome P450 [Ganoderma sinense ZZ0214-1]
MTTPIPSPRALPFIGHVTHIDSTDFSKSLNLLAQQYGDIYELSFFGDRRIIVNSYKLTNEVCDDKRFPKTVNGALDELRHGLGDALFTAYGPEEQNWGIAHRLLMPCFGTASIHNMFDDMMDVVHQLVLKWERFGPREKIDPSNDYTRLTLDAISLCTMSYRLNSFYREEPHPFVTAMVDFLLESGRRPVRPSLVQAMMTGTNAKYDADINTLNTLVEEILQDHRANPPEKPDLVQIMLTGRDKETGLGMSDQNIRGNLLTFLIAGHETTSGMLTFATYFILKNPETYRKLREEIDTLIGDRSMTTHDIGKLPYLLAVMRETLRLGPTAPLRTIRAAEDTVIGGKYLIEKGVSIHVNLCTMMRDPKVWGEDADQFRPERMLDGKFEALPPNAWQPFGFGMRGCIGRPFAWQEAQLALVTILQHFDLVMDDPSYELKVKQTLTIKPDEFYIRAIPRKDRSRLLSVPASAGPAAKGQNGTASSTTAADASEPGLQPLFVLYGSNTGSSKSFAERLAADAPTHGFCPSIATLDSASANLPKGGPIVIVTASFEGLPADNAGHFVSWLENVKEKVAFGDVKFAVFGCGNRDWVNTYQRVPRLIDGALAAHGAKRLVERGEGDASGSEFFEAFDTWEKSLWEKLSAEYGTTTSTEAGGIDIKTVSEGTARAEILREKDTALGTVVENRVLTSPNAPVKRHIEFDLPEGMTYRAGDYLAILPINPERVVHRATARFGMSTEQEVEISSSVPTSLPVGKPITIHNLLRGYVELQQPATQRDLDILLKAKNSDASTLALKHLSANYAEKVFKTRLSVLDILEENKDIALAFSTFVQMLPSMRIRQYSISSSPLWNAQRVSLTLGVVDAPALSGRAEPFLGVASTYLAGLQAGDKVQLSVRASNVHFHPPTDPTIPLVMVAAGSGLAPMRGFLQERAMQKKAGREVATNLLFFGCRNPNEDLIYGDSDLKEWAELGIVDVRPAFSRSTGDSKGCHYVQDRIWLDREEVSALLKQGAKIYVCGAGRIAVGVKQTFVAFIKEKEGVDEEGAVKIFTEMMKDRYATDIFE